MPESYDIEWKPKFRGFQTGLHLPLQNMPRWLPGRLDLGIAETRCTRAMTYLYSIIESASHPNFSALYRQQSIQELRLPTTRKAIQALKRNPPDIVVAEFFYGFGNNYAGANLGNLDVFLSSLQKYAPQAAVIVMVAKTQRSYAEQLGAAYPLAAILDQPVSQTAMAATLDALQARPGDN